MKQLLQVALPIPSAVSEADSAKTTFNQQLSVGLAAVMIFVAILTATLVTNTGRSAWFAGVFALMIYPIFAMTLYLLPPRVQ